MRHHVPIVEWSGELRYAVRLSTLKCGAEAKASLNRANELYAVDPKPGDLAMSRLKLR